MKQELKIYKALSVSEVTKKNAMYCIKGSSDSQFTLVITDISGIPIYQKDNTGTDAQLAETLSSGSLVEFDTTLIIPALTDGDFNITPTGTEIRDYQIFETSNPSQDITSSVSSLGALPNQLRIFSALAITIKIIGTRK